MKLMKISCPVLGGRSEVKAHVSVAPPLYLYPGECGLETGIRSRRMRPYSRGTFTLVVIASLGRVSTAAGAEPSSTRSTPPDTTPYVRPAVPEDNAPFGQPARGPRAPECDQDVPPGRETTKKAPPPGGPAARKGRATARGRLTKPTPTTQRRRRDETVRSD